MAEKINKAVVGVAKRRSQITNEVEDELTLSTGYRARLLPVSISIINEAQAAIPDPPVPMWYNESKGVEEPNPDHPDYAAAIERTEQERNLAAIDAIIMFGVELVDGLPENDDWLKKMRLRSKMGLTKVDLSQYDLKDPIEIQYIFKKYIAVGTRDIVTLMKFAGVTEDSISEASRSFRSDEVGSTDNAGDSQ